MRLWAVNVSVLKSIVFYLLIYFEEMAIPYIWHLTNVHKCKNKSFFPRPKSFDHLTVNTQYLLQCYCLIVDKDKFQSIKALKKAPSILYK